MFRFDYSPEFLLWYAPHTPLPSNTVNFSTGLMEEYCNISSFMFSKCFIPVRVRVDPEPVRGTLGIRLEYTFCITGDTGVHTHVHGYTFRAIYITKSI